MQHRTRSRAKLLKKVKPDSRMRVHLGELAEGIEGFDVFKDEEGKIILVPFVTVPVHELWINKDANRLAELDLAEEQLKKGQSSKINWEEWDD